MTSTPVRPTRDVDFATRLRTETQAGHTAAEQEPFVADLLGGRLPRAAYIDLLAQSHLIYGALEAAVQGHRDDPDLRPFLHPGLARLAALHRDLTFLMGADWHERQVPTAAALEYRDRIEDAATDSAPVLLAHHYLRYLGDLSGGQIIRRLVSRHYDLGANGTEFYVFADIDSPKRFKDFYRDHLDRLSWDDGRQQQVIDEVDRGFALNTALFAELSARHAG